MIELNISDFGLQHLVAGNGTVMAQHHDLIIRTVLTKLFGFPTLEDLEREDLTNPGARRGILGQIRAYYGVVEPRKSGALHTHIVVWAGVPPEVMQMAASDRALFARLAPVLNHHVSSTIPLETRIDYVASKMDGRPRVHPGLIRPAGGLTALEPTGPNRVQRLHHHHCNELGARLRLVLLFHHLHSHHSGCGKVGEDCRMAYAQLNTMLSLLSLLDQNEVMTYDVDSGAVEGPDQLNAPAAPADATSVLVPRDSMYVFQTARIDLVPQHNEVQQRMQLLIEELTRRGTAANGQVDPLIQQQLDWLNNLDPLRWVSFFERLDRTRGMEVSYNRHISHVVGSSVNVELLGGRLQAASIFAYLSKYMTDSKPVDTKALLGAAIERIGRNVLDAGGGPVPLADAAVAAAADAGQQAAHERLARHLMLLMLMRLKRVQEVGVPQATAALLGYSSFYSSDYFQYLFAGRAYQQALDFTPPHLQPAQSRQTTVPEFFDPAAASNAPAPGRQVDAIPQRINTESVANTGGIWYSLHNTNPHQQPLLLASILLYCCRGRQLRCLSYYEWVRLITVVKVKPDGPRPDAFQFPPGFALRKNWEQVLRPRPATPWIVPSLGDLPKEEDLQSMPDADRERWFEEANRFARRVLAIFLPWTEELTAGRTRPADRFYQDAWMFLKEYLQDLKADARLCRQTLAVNMENAVRGMKVDPEDHEMLRAYRMRGDTKIPQRQRRDAGDPALSSDDDDDAGE